MYVYGRGSLKHFTSTTAREHGKEIQRVQQRVESVQNGAVRCRKPTAIQPLRML